MVKAVGSFVIPLPVGLDGSVLIKIIGQSGTTNLPFTITGTCAVYYSGVKQPIGCNFASSPTQVDYTLTIL